MSAVDERADVTELLVEVQQLRERVAFLEGHLEGRLEMLDRYLDSRIDARCRRSELAILHGLVGSGVLSVEVDEGGTE